MPTNYSYNPEIAPTLLESYLQRRALENVKPNLGYLTDAQFIEQPKNNGKHVKFFRYTELLPVTTPLYEGVTPDPQKLEETAFSVMTKQFGAWMDYTDEIDLWHVDKKTQAMSDRLNRQATLSIDTVGRDQICAGLNVLYPSGISARGSIQTSNVITFDMIKKAVLLLKKKGAQPFSDGYFHAKISHETYHDLTNVQHWIDVSTYQGNDSRVQKYELGTIYKVKFFEVDNAKTFTAESYLDGAETISYLTAYADYDATNRIMTITDTMTEDKARELTGKMVYVQYTSGSAVNTPMCIERIWPSGTANQTKILFRWDPGAAITTNWVTTNTLKIVPSGGGNSCPVHASIIYGTNAFGCVTLGSAKKPNFRIIVKPLGASGDADPLNQRGSIAWKVPFFACAVLQDDFIVRLEHGVSC